MRHRAIEWVKEGECIRCTSHALDNGGYPKIKRPGLGIKRICRAILLRRHGPLPPEIVTRHTCDNRWCINPAHLLTGTRSDNNKDRTERGKTPSGEKHFFYLHGMSGTLEYCKEWKRNKRKALREATVS